MSNEKKGGDKSAKMTSVTDLRKYTQQIWLAGLGAFAQAQKKGTETLQKMLQDGLDLQRQAQENAEQKIADATEKMSVMARQLAHGKVPMAPVKTSAPWDSLEGLFEQRVLQALQRHGWPDSARISELEARVAHLEKQLAQGQTKGSKTKSVAASRRPRNG